MLGDMFEKRSTAGWRRYSAARGMAIMMHSWERLDTARTWAAIAAFSLFLADLVLR